MNGTYTATNNEAILKVTRSGNSNAYITYKNYPGHSPKLSTDTAWNHILIASASYIRIEGFEIEGNNGNLSVSQGEARYQHYLQNYPSGTVDWNYMAPTNTNGIYVRPTSTASANPRHIVIENNVVHDVPGGGIVTEESDYITIQNNTVYNNAWYAVYATSGISVFHSYNSDTNTSSYKNIVRNNKVYNNKALIKWVNTLDYSDGNGIIIDDNKNSQLDGRLAPYTGKTLVTNNISYNNGGSGIHSYSSANVDIINNTSYNNSSQVNYGEIYANGSNNVNLYNNIMYARTGRHITSNSNNSNVNYNYNIYFNGTPAVSGPNDIMSDPLFYNAASGDFRVHIGSKAIDNGTSTLAPNNDFSDNLRPRGFASDRGAYESQNIIGNPSFEWGSLTGWDKEQNAAGITAVLGGTYSGTHKASFNTTAVTKLSQSRTAPLTKTYTVTAYITTNIPSNVKLNIEVNGVNKGSQSVATGGYKKATFTFTANANDSIKVSITAPQYSGGWVGIDNVSVE
jgi:parallel beta-helix repeat protein